MELEMANLVRRVNRRQESNWQMRREPNTESSDLKSESPSFTSSNTPF